MAMISCVSRIRHSLVALLTPRFVTLLSTLLENSSELTLAASTITTMRDLHTPNSSHPHTWTVSGAAAVISSLNLSHPITLSPSSSLIINDIIASAVSSPTRPLLHISATFSVTIARITLTHAVDTVLLLLQQVGRASLSSVHIDSNIGVSSAVQLVDVDAVDVVDSSFAGNYPRMFMN